MKPTEQIKEKLPVADLVAEYVELKPAGKNFKGLCPFHKEKSPSFMVSPDRNIWHCFGCGIGGDIFGFLMQYENIEFIEALKILAEKAGISIGDYSSGDRKKYDRLYEINRIAAEFFVGELQKPDAKKAVEYLKGRGLTEETIEEFEIGYAGSSNDQLTMHLTKMGYKPDELDKAGISFKTKQGTYWDRFRNRIMFPLNNQFGKVVGFTGRIMPGHELENTGKYVNSPETAIFNKSKILYGFDRTKKYIRDSQTAVVVEGQMDVIMSYQDGVKNVVASSGTAMTEAHISALQKVAERLVLVFDNDNAGQLAAERTIDLANKKDITPYVVIFDGENIKDPADMVKDTPGEFAAAIKEAVPGVEYYFHRYDIENQTDIHEKKKALRAVLEKIVVLASPVERMHWTKELATRSKTDEAALVQEMELLRRKGLGVKRDEKKPEPKKQTPKNRVDIIVQRILGLLLEEPKFKDEVVKLQELFPKRYQPVVTYLTKETSKEPDPEIAGVVNAIHLRVGLTKTESPDEEFKQLFDELKKERTAHEKRVLQLQIKKAEKDGDQKELERLLAAYQNLHSNT